MMEQLKSRATLRRPSTPEHESFYFKSAHGIADRR